MKIFLAILAILVCAAIVIIVMGCIKMSSKCSRDEETENNDEYEE